MRTRRRAALKTVIVGLLAWALAGGLVVTVAETAAAAPTPLPSTEVSSPALESLAAGSLEVFTTAGGDALQQSLFPGAIWRRPLNRGGTIQSQPVVVSWGPGRLDIFARGTDNTLWHRASNSGTWSAWESLGRAHLGAGSRILAIGAARRVRPQHRGHALSQDLYVWGMVELEVGQRAVDLVPGSDLLGARPAERRGPKQRERLLPQVLQQRHRLVRLDRARRSLTSQPAVASPASGYLDVVGRGTTGAMYLKRLLPGSGWTA